VNDMPNLIRPERLVIIRLIGESAIIKENIFYFTAFTFWWNMSRFGRIRFAVSGIICVCEYNCGIELGTIHEKKKQQICHVSTGNAQWNMC